MGGPGAAKADDAAWKNVKVTATSIIDGKVVVKPVNNPPKVEVEAAEPPLVADLLPTAPTARRTTPRRSRRRRRRSRSCRGRRRPRGCAGRKKFDGSMSFDVQNLPHGVIVMDIGLNGVLIPEGLLESERQIFLQCAGWVGEQDLLGATRGRKRRGTRRAGR